MDARIDSASICYIQGADSCQEVDVSQLLSIEAIDAGGGHYIVIKTDRWAIDATDIDGFADRLRSVLTLVKG